MIATHLDRFGCRCQTGQDTPNLVERVDLLQLRLRAFLVAGSHHQVVGDGRELETVPMNQPEEFTLLIFGQPIAARLQGGGGRHNGGER